MAYFPNEGRDGIEHARASATMKLICEKQEIAKPALVNPSQTRIKSPACSFSSRARCRASKSSGMGMAFVLSPTGVCGIEAACSMVSACCLRVVPVLNKEAATELPSTKSYDPFLRVRVCITTFVRGRIIAAVSSRVDDPRSFVTCMLLGILRSDKVRSSIVDGTRMNDDVYSSTQFVGRERRGSTTFAFPTA